METRKNNNEEPNKKFLRTDRNDIDPNDDIGQPMGLVDV